MNIAQAKQELARPLRFGDVRQIEARDVLRQVADCADAIEKCDEGHDTAEQIRICDCVAPFVGEHKDGSYDWQIVNEALRQLGYFRAHRRDRT